MMPFYGFLAFVVSVQVLSISVIVVTLRVMCLSSLGDIKIYALVLVEFSSSLKMWKLR